MRAFKLGGIVFLVILIMFLSVALIGQNAEPVSITLFSSSSPDLPKWAVLLICVAIGAILATLFFIVELIILETKNIRLRRTNLLMERLLKKHGIQLETSSHENTDDSAELEDRIQIADMEKEENESKGHFSS